MSIQSLYKYTSSYMVYVRISCILQKTPGKQWFKNNRNFFSSHIKELLRRQSRTGTAVSGHEEFRFLLFCCLSSMHCLIVRDAFWKFSFHVCIPDSRKKEDKKKNGLPLPCKKASWKSHTTHHLHPTLAQQSGQL